MGEQNERKKSSRHPSNIVFNLIALALLLTVIVFLHQILRKPKPAQETEVKSVAALPASPQAQAKADVELPAPPPVQVTLKPEPKVEQKEIAKAQTQAVVDLPTKEPEAKPVEIKAAAKPKTFAKKSYRAEEEISPAELDGETARQNYINENKRLSSGNAKIEKSSTRAVKHSSASSELDREASRRFEAPSKYDLDDEAARQKYLEENKRLSKASGTSDKRKPQPAAKQTSDEYIPFEDR